MQKAHDSVGDTLTQVTVSCFIIGCCQMRVNLTTVGETGSAVRVSPVVSLLTQLIRS